jgi:dihydroneopterin aldolase
MMTLALEGMQFHAFHGYYEEEGILGGDYELDVYVYSPALPETDDDLNRNINYETVYLISKSEMKKPSKLIETVARRIMDRILDYFPEIFGLKIRLRKMHPPLGGPVHSAVVELTYYRPKKKKKKLIG